jgi:hypothetical protein
MMRLKEFEPGATMDRCLDHRRQSFGPPSSRQIFSKVSNIDQRAALPSRHVLVITDPAVGTHR